MLEHTTECRETCNSAIRSAEMKQLSANVFVGHDDEFPCFQFKCDVVDTLTEGNDFSTESKSPTV